MCAPTGSKFECKVLRSPASFELMSGKIDNAKSFHGNVKLGFALDGLPKLKLIDMRIKGFKLLLSIFQ